MFLLANGETAARVPNGSISVAPALIGQVSKANNIGKHGKNDAVPARYRGVGTDRSVLLLNGFMLPGVLVAEE